MHWWPKSWELTVKDHGQLVALNRDSLLAIGEGIESILEHGFFLFLLVRHQVFFLLHVAVIVSNLSPTPKSTRKKREKQTETR